MDGRLLVLQKVMEALGEDGKISSFDQRKRIQKAIYLGQVAGCDLGYRYSWYVKGPYSTDLTRDYYSLSEAVAGGDTAPENKKLKGDIREKLHNLACLFEVPNGVALPKPDWMELLASWHYLLKVNRFDQARAREVMERQKPNLLPFIPAAAARLQEQHLL
ncbi:hypothetical protein [Bradyrhizobium sp. Ai1a-2]|uniref:hypothetical protein n=1 Tax=Bradyrhizobium sp. Ai1a-2 TaxID=196490 RepID=UPI00047FE81F|nr:hypothetical protein [Bradyrhizobium sp. Ai1a-2]